MKLCSHNSRASLVQNVKSSARIFLRANSEDAGTPRSGLLLKSPHSSLTSRYQFPEVVAFLGAGTKHPSKDALERVGLASVLNDVAAQKVCEVTLCHSRGAAKDELWLFHFI